jgi:hypothetical protein
LFCTCFYSGWEAVKSYINKVLHEMVFLLIVTNSEKLSDGFRR